MTESAGGIGDIMIMIGVGTGMFGASQAMVPIQRRKISRRLAVILIVTGLALAYAGLLITGDTNALQEFMDAPKPPSADEY